MADGYIDIDVKLNDAQASSQADKMGKQLGKQISSSVDSAAKTANTSTQQAMQNIGSSLTGYGTAMSKAVTIPILAAGAASGAAAVKIDTALTGVRKTVDGTEEQYEALKDAAIEFSKTNAVDPAQILDIQALGAQLGYTIDELDMFGEVVSGLDIATNMNAGEAATELAQFANIMGMAHGETKNYGSTIVALGNNFATTEADISHMAMRIAGAGKQIGMSEADVLGLATALSSMGIEAEAGGTAISTIMSNIDKAVATNSDSLATWASAARMSVDEFASAWKNDPVQALSAVLSGMDAATQEGGNMSVMLEELGINAIRQTDTLKRLANNVDMLPRAVSTANSAWQENIALDKEVENRNASIAAQLQILWNKVQAVATEIGEPLVNALIDVIDAAEPFIEMLASGAKVFGDLDEEGQRAIIMAVAAAAALGPLTTGVGKLLTATGKSAERWRDFSNNLKTIKTNLAQSSTAVSQSATAFGKYFAVQRNGTTEVYKVNKSTGEYVQTNSKLAKAIATTTVGIKAQDAAMKASSAVMNAAKGAATALGNALKTIAPLAAIAALTKVAEVIGRIHDEAAKTDKANQGLRKSIDSYNEAYSKTSKSFEDARNSAERYRYSLNEIKDASAQARDSQAELADSLTNLWSETGTNNAMVDEYLSTIKELSGGYDELGNKQTLSADDQAKLQAAVEGLNKIMGTSYSVVDAQTGKLNENRDAIERSARAWQDRALAEAASTAKIDLMKQHIENQTALSKAKIAAVEAENEYNAALQAGQGGLGGYLVKLNEANNEVARLEEQDRSVVDQMGAVDETVKELTETYRSSKDALTNYVNATAEWGSALGNAGIDADEFSEKLSNLGISTDDLAKIMNEKGKEGIDGFIAAYQQGDSELTEWMAANGLEGVIGAIEGKKEELSKAGHDSGSAVNEGLYNGLSENAQLAVSAALNTVGLTTAEFNKLAAQAGIEGDEAAITFANSLALHAPQAQAAGKKNADGAASGLRSQNNHSNTWGWDLGINFASGLGKAYEPVVRAATYLANGAKSILGFSVPDAGPWSGSEQGGKRSGKHLVQNFAEGMLEGKQDAVNAADAVARDISDELMAQFAAMDAMGQIEASIGRGMSTASIIANSGGISNTTTTWNINQPIATPDELMRQQRLNEKYYLAGSRL